MEPLTSTHCLDACAIIAYLRTEPGAEVLKEVIERPNTLLAMHVCNLGEVYYDFFRADGIEAAQTAWVSTLALPLELRRDADDAFIQRVGIIKVEERVSFADAFALALSERLSIPLVTTDHHEFDPIEQKGHFRFLWLR
ncbi:MAG TPA: PIN domain-containing protein [Candidatus Binatia bacterium]|nr:PIN domain-containing protein [Candidatus Binatia bacterium]